MSKERRIRLKPFHSDIKATVNGFQWTFLAESELGNRYTIVFNFDFWWLTFLARDMWSVLRDKKKKIEECETAMRGPQ